MGKKVDAEELADLFRDMADFAKTEKERKALLTAVKTVEELPGESDESSEKPFVWRIKRDCGVPYMICPKCGFETQNLSQPRRERWNFCPGCGHRCLKFGSEPNIREYSEAETGSQNSEGYSDPTAYLALRNIENRKDGFPDFGNGSGLKS